MARRSRVEVLGLTFPVCTDLDSEDGLEAVRDEPFKFRWLSDVIRLGGG